MVASAAYTSSYGLKMGHCPPWAMAISIKTMMTNQRMEWYNIVNPTIDLPFGEWDDSQQLPSMYGDVRDGLLVRVAV